MLFFPELLVKILKNDHIYIYIYIKLINTYIISIIKKCRIIIGSMKKFFILKIEWNKFEVF
jgi:hypothetical protein